MPGTYEHDFFIGMPFSLREANKLSTQIVKNQQSNLALLRSTHAENVMALNEIAGGIDVLARAVDNGFDRLGDAVYFLEESLRTELGGIKWVLAQMDSKFAQLLHLVQFPRETEAGELIGDGLKAMATGNLDDAEHCLGEAVEKKRTSFQAHLNLGFVFLHKGSTAGALKHFKKAVDYAPQDNDTDILALENLARAHFAAQDFKAAHETMERAWELRRARQCWSDGSAYRSAVYTALSGHEDGAIKRVLTLCVREPKYFAIAATDQDFSSIHSPLIQRLDVLARETNEKAVCQCKAEADLLDAVTKDNRDIDHEVAAVRSALDRTRERIQKGTYSDSARAIKNCAQISRVVTELPALALVRQELSVARQELSTANTEGVLLQERLQFFQKKNKAAQKRDKALKDSFWVVVLGACLLSVLISIIIYNIGTSRGDHPPEFLGSPRLNFVIVVFFAAAVLWIPSYIALGIIGWVLIFIFAMLSPEEAYRKADEAFRRNQAFVSAKSAAISKKRTEEERIKAEVTALRDL